MFSSISTYFFKKGSLILLVLMLGLSIFAVGCGTDNSTGEVKTEEPKVEEKRVIKHAMGETEVPSSPQRVVILTNEGTEALLALGVKPVGAVQSWTGDPWYEHIKMEMTDVEVVGLESQVNLEAIAALKPDLILGNKMRQEEVYSQLSAIAPTVFSDTLRGKWQDNFTLYAQALNKESEGQRVLDDFDKKINEFKVKAGDKLSTKVSVVRFMTGMARIYYKDTFSGVIFDQIGLARPDAQNKNEFAEEVIKERIPEMEGDILFYFTYDTGDGKALKTEEEWTADPLFKSLDVAKSNKVYKVNDAIWNTAGGVKAANLLLDDLSKYFFAQ